MLTSTLPGPVAHSNACMPPRMTALHQSQQPEDNQHRQLFAFAKEQCPASARSHAVLRVGSHGTFALQPHEQALSECDQSIGITPTCASHAVCVQAITTIACAADLLQKLCAQATMISPFAVNVYLLGPLSECRQPRTPAMH